MNGHHKGTGEGAVRGGTIIQSGIASHMTRRGSAKSIQRDGLKPMERTAVQLVHGHPHDDFVSGSKHWFKKLIMQNAKIYRYKGVRMEGLHDLFIFQNPMVTSTSWAPR